MTLLDQFVEEIVAFVGGKRDEYLKKNFDYCLKFLVVVMVMRIPLFLIFWFQGKLFFRTNEIDFL